MMKRFAKWLSVMMAAVAVGCGGGGGSSLYGGGGTGGGSGAATYSMAVDVQRSGTSTTQVSSSETVQAIATVQSSNGTPVEGVVVTFAESGPSLLTLAPTSGTALTDASGRATVDLSAATAATTGATTISASTTVSGTAVTGSRALQLTASGGGGPVVPQAAAINFVSANPSGTAIVIRGAGGSGRSESATLTFRVVDGSSAPINGATVSFALNSASSAAGVTLNTQSATSNSSGVVTTSVTSGDQPTTVIVTATVTSAVTPAGATVSTQSDSIVVSTSVAVAEAFEIVAEKYNLDGRLTGDSTTISAFVADANGNPVADGVAVSFTTDAGAVASSNLGGCLTQNGRCDVTFRVQEPRGTGLATVIATTQVGGTTTLSDSLQINMAGSNADYIILNADPDDSPVSSVAMNGVCTRTFSLRLSDGNGRAPAAGTTITADPGSSGVTASIKTGSPVADQLGVGFPPAQFTVEVVVATAAPASCLAGGGATDTGFFLIRSTTPNGIVFPQRVDVVYPR